MDGEYAAAVDREMANWCQGDVANELIFTWLSDDRPITPEGASLSPDGPTFVKTEPMGAVVVTQTCDIRRNCWNREGTGRPFVQVSPLVRLDGAVLRDAAGGFSPRFAPVPGAGQNAFADLDRCVTVEKGVLARVRNRTVGCTTDAERQSFSRAVARQRGRHPFPDCVESTLSRLRDFLRDKRDRSGPVGNAVRFIDSIRASAAPEFSDEDPFELSLTFIISPLSLPIGSEDASAVIGDELAIWLEAGRERSGNEIAGKLLESVEIADRYFLWQRLVNEWISRCRIHPPVQTVFASAESLASYPLGRARCEPQLDLDHFTSEADRIAEGEVFSRE